MQHDAIHATTPFGIFVTQLLQSGKAIAAPWEWPNQLELAEATLLIQTIERNVAAEAPFTPPALNEKSACWSLSVVAWSCSLFVDRGEDNTQLPKELIDHQPRSRSAVEQWSVDLGFRFLHSLLVRCDRVSPNDTLVHQIVELCKTWPLACVGRAIEIDEQSLAITLDDPSLRTILVDRIIERDDRRLAEHPLVAPFVASGIGAYEDFLRSVKI